MGFGDEIPKRVLGLESRARCAGFSVTEIGNRKERLHVREAGASAASRGQRPYASFPEWQPHRPPRFPQKGRLFRSFRVTASLFISL